MEEAIVAIVTILSNIVLNVISDDVSNGKMNIVEKIKFFLFKRKTKNWLQTFCKGKDGTVLTSGRFQTYLDYYKPIKKIYEHVVECDGVFGRKDEFIRNLIEEAKNSCGNNGYKITVMDESIIKELR